MATVAELEADRAEIVAAKLKFLRGEAVREVSRAGRKLVFQTNSISDFDNAIALIDRDIIAAQALVDGTRRRRAFSVNFG